MGIMLGGTGRASRYRFSVSNYKYSFVLNDFGILDISAVKFNKLATIRSKRQTIDWIAKRQKNENNETIVLDLGNLAVKVNHHS